MSTRTVKAVIWTLLVLECAAIIAIRRPWLATDSLAYLRLADGIDRTGFARFGFFDGSQFFPERIRPPGYPYILATLVHQLHLPHVVVVVLQMALYLFSVWLIARVARAYQRETPFLLICLLCPFAAYYSGILMTEAWAIALTTVVVVLILRQVQRPSHIGALGIGAAAAAAALVRSNLILLVLLGIALLLPRWRAAALCVAGAALVLLPFTFRNYQEFGAFSPLQPTPSTGSSFYQAVWQRELERADIHGYVHQGKTVPELERVGFVQQNAAMNRSIGVPERMGLTTEEYPAHLQARADAHMQRAAFARIRDQPLAYGWHVLRNLFQLGNPRSYPKVTPFPIELIMRAIMAVVWIAGLTALVVMRRQSRTEVRIASVFIFVFLGTLMWFLTEPRYMSPVLLLVYLNASLALPTLASAFDRS